MSYGKVKCECGKDAVWLYLPATSFKRQLFYCDDCVPKGCSCNSYPIDGDYENQNPDNWKVDEETPCVEYDYSEKGYSFAKIIIAGGREFSDYELLALEAKTFIEEIDTDIVEIVSGKARGADSLGEKWAKEQGHTIKEFPADWEKHGRSAGYLRNSEMANYATHCLCFWDGKSKGTKHMIDLATKKGLMVKIVFYDES